MGANTRHDRLSDYERHRANVLVVCGCGHRGVLDAGKLRRWFFCHCWNDAIEVLGAHLRCSVCLGRPARIGITKERPDRPEWMALDGDWKRLVQRLRD